MDRNRIGLSVYPERIRWLHRVPSCPRLNWQTSLLGEHESLAQPLRPCREGSGDDALRYGRAKAIFRDEAGGRAVSRGPVRSSTPRSEEARQSRRGSAECPGTCRRRPRAGSRRRRSGEHAARSVRGRSRPEVQCVRGSSREGWALRASFGAVRLAAGLTSSPVRPAATGGRVSHAILGWKCPRQVTKVREVPAVEEPALPICVPKPSRETVPRPG